MQPIGEISHRGGAVQLVRLACRELDRLGRRHHSGPHRCCRLPPVVMRLGQFGRGLGRCFGLGVVCDSLWRRVWPLLDRGLLERRRLGVGKAGYLGLAAAIRSRVGRENLHATILQGGDLLR